MSPETPPHTHLCIGNVLISPEHLAVCAHPGLFGMSQKSRDSSARAPWCVHHVAKALHYVSKAPKCVSKAPQYVSEALHNHSVSRTRRDATTRPPCGLVGRATSLRRVMVASRHGSASRAVGESHRPSSVILHDAQMTVAQASQVLIGVARDLRESDVTADAAGQGVRAVGGRQGSEQDTIFTLLPGQVAPPAHLQQAAVYIIR